MADTLEQFLRTSKVLYERMANEITGGKKGIDKFLFPTMDIDDGKNFTLDSIITNPHGIVFRGTSEQSVVRPYEAGSGEIYTPPRASEKTPITEDLRDSVVAGFEATAGFAGKHAKMLSRIFRNHIVAHNVTKWWLALETMRTGNFSPYGINGNDIDLAIDFSRNAACDITYDFTASGATIDAALKDMYDAYRTQEGPKPNLAIIMGSDWQAELEGDSDVLEKMRANTANVLIQQNLMPPEINNTYGLHLLGRYRPAGVIVPIWLLAFEPDAQFVQYKGATATDFMPSDEALMFNIDSSRFSVYRGVDVLEGSGKAKRTSGEIVLDSFTSEDPVTEYIRSQTRFAFIPAEIDHTIRSTGTFSES